MKKKFEAFLLSPAYPFLLGLYPILNLYSTNSDQLRYTVLFRPLLLSLLLILLLFIIFKFLFYRWHKAAFFAFFLILFFITYGHIDLFLQDRKISNAFFYIFTGWAGTVLPLTLFIRKYAKRLKYSSFAPALNLIGIILLLYPIGIIIKYSIAEYIALSSSTDKLIPTNIPNSESLPDIYYIILDGYGRSDVLNEMYSYDNKEFIDGLESLGFYVAKCSQSNYPNTGLSLTSSLNMDYIPNISEHLRPDNRAFFYLFASLKNNSLINTLDSLGYTTLTFASGFPWTEMRGFDSFLSPQSKSINEFEVMYLKTTFIRFFDTQGIIDLEDIAAERYRERTRFVFNNLSGLSEIQSPKFVFVHIIAPHSPYGFDAEGNSISPKQVSSSDGYIYQATYVGREVLERVEELIEQSSTPPIIIIQGDHGPYTPRPEWRLGILNAYYLPEKKEVLYPTITPVNTFRLVLDEYFGANYGLLEDKSYTVEMPYLYDFTLFENPCEP